MIIVSTAPPYEVTKPVIRVVASAITITFGLEANKGVKKTYPRAVLLNFSLRLTLNLKIAKRGTQPTSRVAWDKPLAEALIFTPKNF